MSTIPWQESNKSFIERIHIYDKFKENAAKFLKEENTENKFDLQIICRLLLDMHKKKILFKWKKLPIAEIQLKDDELNLCKELICEQNQTTALLNHEHSSGVVKTLSEALLFRMRTGQHAKHFVVKISVDLGSF